MIARKHFSYQREKDYYGEAWPVEAKPYDDLEPYFSAWLGERAAVHFNEKRVLDIGAGEATYTRFIAKNYRPELVVALDLFHQRLVPACRSFAEPNFSAVCGDCFSLPFGDGAFDTVFGSLVLHQVMDLDLVVREISRVLKPGGVYVGIEPNFSNVVILARLMFGRHSPNQYMFGRRHLRNFESADFDVGIRYFYWKWPNIRSRSLGTCVGLLLTKKHILLSRASQQMVLSVVIPSGKRANLIFRAEMNERRDVPRPRVGSVIKATSVAQSLRLLRAWFNTFGLAECVRLVAKLLRGKRYVMAVVVGKEIASYGWLYGIHSYDFPIDDRDGSIALISTRTFFRGLGLGETVVRGLLDLAAEMKNNACFIETASDNDRMLKVIQNCDCWTLVGSYLRLGKRYM